MDRHEHNICKGKTHKHSYLFITNTDCLVNSLETFSNFLKTISDVTTIPSNPFEHNGYFKQFP